jgi:hypothetical protein
MLTLRIHPEGASMKKILMLAFLLLPGVAIAAKEDIGLTAHNLFDTRTSLDLTPPIKHRLLVNMRAQLATIQTITGLLADEKFGQAYKISRAKLGLSDELKQIYERANNDDYKNLALTFHDSADKLGAALQTKDMKKSLQALRNAMGYCVQCHNKFRQ